MFSKTKPSQLFVRGCELMDQQRWEQAIREFENLLKLDPRHIDVLYNLGICYANIGDFEKALTHYNKALKINPSDIEVNYNAGVAYYELGNLSQAIASYQRALEIDDRHLASWANLAWCYYIEALVQLSESYKRISGNFSPLKRLDDFHTAFSIIRLSENPLFNVALGVSEDVHKSVELSIKCYDEAIERSDTASLRAELSDRKGKLIKLFGL